MNVEKPCGVSGILAPIFYHRNDFIGTPELPGLPADANGASFNFDAVKAEMAKKMQQAEAASKGPSQ